MQTGPLHQVAELVENYLSHADDLLTGC